MRSASQVLSEAQVPLPVPSRSSECTPGRPGLHKHPLLYQAQTRVLMPLLVSRWASSVPSSGGPGAALQT